MTASLETAGKLELRLLCKANGLKGYGSMTVEQMRDALKAHAARGPARMTDAVPVVAHNLDSDPGKPDAATEARVDKALPVTDDGHTPIRAARKQKKQKAAKPRAAKAKSDAPSIREWLETRLAKGELKVEDALAYAEKSGRSKVTVYRQARELSYAARKGIFVKVRS